MQLSRWNVIRSLIWRRWKAAILVIWGLIGTYDLIVSQLVPPDVAEEMPRIWDALALLPSIGLPWYVWVIGMLVLLLIFVFEALFRENRRLRQHVEIMRKEPPELVILGELRSEGVRIRNAWVRLDDPDDLPDFQAIYEDWNERMLTTIRSLSPGQASWLRTLDRWRWQHSRGLNNDHLRYLNIIDEKLRRLDIVMKQYLSLE